MDAGRIRRVLPHDVGPGDAEDDAERQHQPDGICQLSGQPRFVDNGDGTITDHQTCLMWEKKYKLDGGANYADPQAADNYFSWAGYCSVNNAKYCQPSMAPATACAANAEGGTLGCDECTGGDGTCTMVYGSDTAWSRLVALNTAAFAGHSDWRLLKREELASIVDYAAVAPPVVDATFNGGSCGGTCTFITAPSSNQRCRIVRTPRKRTWFVIMRW